MRNLSDCRLYGILDLSYVDEPDIERVASAMVEGGVDIIQLRAKQKRVAEIVDLARTLNEITCAHGIPFIVNDHAEIAAEVPISGVHLGQDDDSIALGREKASRRIIVGKSTHSLGQAVAAQNEGADYIGFGPIFSTPTKPDYKAIGLDDINSVHQKIKVPIFCIGGVKLENVNKLIAAGARRVAIVSGLLKASHTVEYAKSCKQLLCSVL